MSEVLDIQELVDELRQLKEKLRLAELDGAYWRGRAEALETKAPKSGGNNLANFLAKLKEAQVQADG